MEDAGQKLRKVREGLELRYRDVEELSLRIADHLKNNEFAIALSRLADIENRGTVPSLYKLFSLCAIYRLDLAEVMRWYGVDPAAIPGQSARLDLPQTHLASFAGSEPAFSGNVPVPLSLDPGFDWRKSAFLSRMIQRWGPLPIQLLAGSDLPNLRLGFIGLDDDFMSPLLLPGALVLIDDSVRKIAEGGWANEFSRPIYFLEHHGGCRAAWCSLAGAQLILQPHPASGRAPEVYAADSVDILGQVTGLAMRLVPDRRRGRS